MLNPNRFGRCCGQERLKATFMKPLALNFHPGPANSYQRKLAHRVREYLSVRT
jgi:hypothetical protein